MLSANYLPRTILLLYQAHWQSHANELSMLKKIHLAFGMLSSHNLEEMPTDKILEHESSLEKEGFPLERLLPPSGTTEVAR